MLKHFHLASSIRDAQTHITFVIYMWCVILRHLHDVATHPCATYNWWCSSGGFAMSVNKTIFFIIRISQKTIHRSMVGWMAKAAWVALSRVFSRLGDVKPSSRSGSPGRFEVVLPGSRHRYTHRSRLDIPEGIAYGSVMSLLNNSYASILLIFVGRRSAPSRSSVFLNAGLFTWCFYLSSSPFFPFSFCICVIRLLQPRYASELVFIENLRHIENLRQKALSFDIVVNSHTAPSLQA